MRYQIIGYFSLFVCLVLLTGGINDKPMRRDILVLSGDAVMRADPDTSIGRYCTIAYVLPVDLPADRLDQALLEIYVDVSAKARDEYVNEAPVLEVYALTAPLTTGIDTETLDLRSCAARPVSRGMRKRVLLDVTRIIRAHLTGELSNQGIVLGNVTGTRDGDFQLIGGVLGDGVVGRIRLYVSRAHLQ